MHDSSLGTNQSERSGSTFSLPGNQGSCGGGSHGGAQRTKNNLMPWHHTGAANASPKSQTLAI